MIFLTIDPLSIELHDEVANRGLTPADNRKEYLKIYKKESEDHLGCGGSSEWTNQDFEKLGDLTFEKTGVRLNASTLKRVWGKVKYESAPTEGTGQVLDLEIK